MVAPSCSYPTVKVKLIVSKSGAVAVKLLFVSKSGEVKLQYSQAVANGQLSVAPAAAARTRAIDNEAKGGEPVKGQLEVLDPVCGKPVMASELTLMAPEEVDAFLKEWAK